MNTFYTGCPVSYAYAHRMTRPETGFDTFFGSLDVGDLEEEARMCTISPEVARLRAFYAVELLCHEVISRRLFQVTASSIMVMEYVDSSYPRTLTGLSKLSADMKKLQRRLSALETVSVLKKDRTNSSMQVAGTYNKLCLVLDMVLDCIDILSGCLYRDDISCLERIGELLADALCAALYPMSEMEEHLRALLRING